MIMSIGSFKFLTKANIEKLNRSVSSGVSFHELISNNVAAVFNKKWDETISIDGNTLPIRLMKEESVEKLFNMAKSERAYVLSSGTGKYIGKFVIVSISEVQSYFDNSGNYFQQSFSMQLRRVSDD